MRRTKSATDNTGLWQNSSTPCVVLSNNDGAVVSRSSEAKALGIKMGEPWFKIKDFAKQHGIVAFSSNYALYADMSNRVMNILADFSPIQEVYSIDECFLDLTGFTDIRDRSYAMRTRILKWTGIPVCVGIGPTKTLAKLSNHIAKKHPKSAGVFDYNQLSNTQQENVLGHLEVREVWGIGRQLSKRLNEIGITSVLHLRDADIATMRTRFGVVTEKSIRELRGEACLEIEDVTPPRKQIISSRSFGNCVVLIEDLADALTHFVANTSGKLRDQKSVASLLQVFIQTNRCREDKPQYNPSISIHIPTPTSDSIQIATYAMQGLKAIFKEGYEYKKAGIILGEISPEHIVQENLFTNVDTTPRTKLMDTMDGINAKYGRGTLKLSGDGSRRAWAMRTEHKSPCYTTDIEEIPTCK